MSSELVPLSYGREPYNLIHHTESETHTDALSATEAARINAHYNVQIYFGRHGTPASELTGDPLEVLRVPTQLEYDEAAAVVADMRPGDTLFAEGIAFHRQPTESKTLTELRSRLTETGIGGESAIAINGIFEIFDRMQHERIAAGRQNGTLSAWDYLEELATQKGIRIVRADYDAYEHDAFRALGNGKDIPDLISSPSLAEHALGLRASPPRERAARNILKDDALAHLPPEGTPPLKGRRPKLVLVFGAGHEQGMKQAFADVGLDATINVMKTTPEADRIVEKFQGLKTDEQRIAFVARYTSEIMRGKYIGMISELPGGWLQDILVGETPTVGTAPSALSMPLWKRSHMRGGKTSRPPKTFSRRSD